MSKEFSDFINKVNKDGGDSGYTPIAYTGDHSMKNGTVGQQSNHSGGISNEAEGKDDEDSGIDMKLNSDGIYVPSYNALGTNYWKGGKTYVNENGGEIMDLPRGTRIIPADKSEKMTAKGNEVKVIVNVENLYGEDEKFINRIGDAIGYKLAKLL